MQSGPLGILQAFRFGASDRAHVGRLLHWAELDAGMRVADLGAGSGTVAAHMAALRPDLRFCLIDRDPDVLANAGFASHAADITEVPEPDGSFDAVIAMYAIGYAPPGRVFAEMARLLRPGGIAFVVDMIPAAGAETVALFGYEVRSRGLIDTAARAAGLAPDLYIEPHDPGDWGRRVFSGAFDILFGDVRPAIWRFVART